MSVLFKNHQWQVTNHGLETVAELVDSYVPQDSLLNLRTVGSEVFYEWPLHMAEKTWLEYGAFEEAFRIAIKRHSPSADVNTDRLEASIQKGREIADQTQGAKTG